MDAANENHNTERAEWTTQRQGFVQEVVANKKKAADMEHKLAVLKNKLTEKDIAMGEVVQQDQAKRRKITLLEEVNCKNVKTARKYKNKATGYAENLKNLATEHTKLVTACTKHLAVTTNTNTINTSGNDDASPWSPEDDTPAKAADGIRQFRSGRQFDADSGNDSGTDE
jgi:hypothetical protein